ncbi:MAG: penicillin-binding protein activator [Sphingomonadales bacterium]|nr:penicillin-binding protein activator [Sphingomonadales bacterium]
MRGVWRIAVVALLAMLVAGCQTLLPKGAEPPVQPTTQPSEPVVEPGLPTDTERHRVALLVPQTGENAGVGQSIANMTTMALLDSKSERVRITTYDTARGAEAAARQAIADGNKLILGPLLSSDVKAVAPIARAANVPLLSFSNDTAVAGNGTFLLGYVPTQAVERVVEYAQAKGYSNFAALAPEGPYGERALAAMRSVIKERGGALLAAERYGRSATELSGAVRRLGRIDGYDAVLIADGGRIAVQAAPALKQANADVRLLGTELWNTDASLAGSPALRGAWFASVSDGLYGQLADKYRARYGEMPFRLSALAYDAVLLTVRVSRDWKPGTTFPINRLFASDGFGGIDGIFRFDNLGIAQRALEVSEVKAGGFAVIEAAPTKW